LRGFACPPRSRGRRRCPRQGEDTKAHDRQWTPLFPLHSFLFSHEPCLAGHRVKTGILPPRSLPLTRWSGGAVAGELSWARKVVSTAASYAAQHCMPHGTKHHCFYFSFFTRSMSRQSSAACAQTHLHNMHICKLQARWTVINSSLIS
jgi:hypothetical protein